MAHPEDSAATPEQAATPDSAAKPEPAAASSDAAAAETPGIDPPNAEPQPEPASVEPRKIEYLQLYTPRAYSPGADQADAADEPPPTFFRRHLPLAASLAISAALGALVGVAATATLKSDEPATAAIAASRRANHALQDSMVRLQGEMATLRAGITASQRSTGTQIGKLSERIERAEKAQAEPAAKLAKLLESVERLEHRPQQQAAAQPVQGVLPGPDVTGSVAAKDAKQDTKPDAKPPVAEGWRLVDVYGNRAMVESRTGRMYEVVVGANLPTLGRVEAIKRDSVVTRNGIIAAVAEPPRRRQPYFYQD